MSLTDEDILTRSAATMTTPDGDADQTDPSGTDADGTDADADGTDSDADGTDS